MSALCTLEFQDEGAIALVTLNHPADANAMSPELGFGQFWPGLLLN